MIGPILSTERLALRELEPADAPFILRLLNEPDFIANIRDAGVRDEAGAIGYIEAGPRASYAQYGFGLWCVEELATGEKVGMCGLLKRDSLEDPDVGFAFLEPYRGRGYATEAARAVLDWGARTKALKRIVAIVSPHNTASAAVLEKSGMILETEIESPEGKPLLLYGWAPPAPAARGAASAGS